MATKDYSKRSRLIIALAVITTIIVLTFGMTLGLRVVKLEKLWSEYNLETTTKYELLNQLRAHMGYGGFIHNFKNLVLRRDENLIAPVQLNIDEVRSTLAEFHRFDLSSDEQTAISQFEAVFMDYVGKFDLAKELISQGVSPIEIDIQVQVEDAQAYAALNFMRESFHQQSTAKQQETDQAAKNILRFLFLGILIIPIIFIISTVLIRFVGQIINVNAALQESERRYRYIIEEAVDTVYTADLEGRFTFISPPAMKLTGYGVDDLLGMHFQELVRTDWKQRVQDFYEKQFQQQVSETTLEFPIITAFGKEKWVEQTVSPLVSSGQVTGFQSIVRDVTARKKIEEDLVHNRDLLETISQAQSKFIVEDNPRVLFDKFLQNLLRITGSDYGFIGEVNFDPEGAPYLKTHSITNIAWNDETRKFYEQNAPDGMEFRNLKTLFGAVMTSGKPVIANDPANDPRRGGLPEGHPAMHTFLGVPFYSGKEIVGMLGLANRVGGYDEELIKFLEPFANTAANIIQGYRSRKERKVAEQALQDSEARIRAIVDTAIDGIIVINERGIIEMFNRGAEKLFGYTADEVLGHNVKMLMPEVFSREHDGYLNNYKQTGKRKIIGIGREVECLRKDGIIIPIHLSISEVKLEGHSIFAGIIHDISERKQAEEELRAARDSAEQATQAKSEFLANMSHELRTPLNSVIGFASVLAKNKADHLGEKELLYIERINDNGLHLLNLINDVLDLSKVEAGKMNLELSDVALDQTVTDTVAQLKGQLLGKRVKLLMEIPDEVSKIETDEAKLKQVLINLVGNALKFTIKGNVTISIHTNPETHRPERIEVKDTGIGIPEDRLAVVFDAFQQAESGTTRKYGGTGLGLAISNTLCNLMGYNLSVTSEIGVGTTFTVDFREQEERIEAEQ